MTSSLYEGPHDYREIVVVTGLPIIVRTRQKVDGRAGPPDRGEFFENEEGDPRDFKEAFEDAVNALGEGYAKVDDQPFGPSSEYVRHFFGVEPPERLARFYDSGEWEEYYSAISWGAPMWSEDNVFVMVFDDPILPYLPTHVTDARPEDHDGMVPLSMLDISVTTDFAAVDTSTPECPVRLWSHGSGKYYDWAPSLDAFLGGLDRD